MAYDPDLHTHRLLIPTLALVVNCLSELSERGLLRTERGVACAKLMKQAADEIETHQEFVGDDALPSALARQLHALALHLEGKADRPQSG